jgi:hypothetical protein
MGDCVLDQRFEHGRARPAAASARYCGHPTHAPRSRPPVGSDEADRDQLLVVERSDRERIGRLVGRQLGGGLMWSQDGLTQRPGLGNRNRSDFHLGHGSQG